MNNQKNIFNFKMTPREALSIQAMQIKHYAPYCDDLEAKVASITKIDGINLDDEMSLVEINRIVPRGAAIERICGIS